MKQLKSKLKVIVLERMCKSCVIYVELYPTKALGNSPEERRGDVNSPRFENPDQCSECSICESLSPDFATFVIGES